MSYTQAGLERGSYDTVTCLSVTKWVHLNRGDEGLKQLLLSIYQLLAPRGRLILEPQPWRSYKAALHKPVGSDSLSHTATVGR